MRNKSVISEARDIRLAVELIELGAHVAHTGPLRFSQAWKIDKRHSAELAQDASNFFEIAERVR